MASNSGARPKHRPSPSDAAVSQDEGQREGDNGDRIVREEQSKKEISEAEVFETLKSVINGSTRKTTSAFIPDELQEPEFKVDPDTVEVSFYRTVVKEEEYQPTMDFVQQKQKQEGRMIKPENFFRDSDRDKPVRSVALVGGAGYGKSEMSRRIAADVLDKKIPQLREVEIVHHMSFRDIEVENKVTPGELLFGEKDLPSGFVEPSVHWIKNNPKKFLLVLDGADQYQEELGKSRPTQNHERKMTPTRILDSILSGSLFPGIRVLYTSREHAIRGFQTDLRADRVVALAGFRLNAVEKLIHGLAGKEGGWIWKHLRTKSPMMLSSCSVPMNLIFTVLVMIHHKDQPPEKLSEVLILLLQYHITSDHVDRRTILQAIHELKSMSYRGTKQRRVTFTSKDLPSSPHSLRDLIIPLPGSKHYQRVLDGGYRFILCHQILQEILTALYVAELPLAEFQSFVKNEFWQSSWVIIRRLLVGILLNDSTLQTARDINNGDGILRISDEESLKQKRKMLKRSLEKQIRNNPERHDLLELLHDFHECDSGLDDVIKSCTRVIDLNFMTLTQNDVHVLASTLRRCSQLEKLYLYGTSLSSSQLRMLASAMQENNLKIKILVIKIGYWGQMDHDDVLAICDMTPHITDELQIRSRIPEEDVDLFQNKLNNLPRTSLEIKFFKISHYDVMVLRQVDGAASKREAWPGRYGSDMVQQKHMNRSHKKEELQKLLHQMKEVTEKKKLQESIEERKQLLRFMHSLYDTDRHYLADVMRSVNVIDLHGIPLTATDLEVLQSVLPSCKQLDALNLQRCHLKPGQLKTLLKYVPGSSLKIDHFNIKGNSLSKEDMLAAIDLWKDHVEELEYKFSGSKQDQREIRKKIKSKDLLASREDLSSQESSISQGRKRLKKEEKIHRRLQHSGRKKKISTMAGTLTGKKTNKKNSEEKTQQSVKVVETEMSLNEKRKSDIEAERNPQPSSILRTGKETLQHGVNTPSGEDGGFSDISVETEMSLNEKRKSDIEAERNPQPSSILRTGKEILQHGDSLNTPSGEDGGFSDIRIPHPISIQSTGKDNKTDPVNESRGSFQRRYEPRTLPDLMKNKRIFRKRERFQNKLSAIKEDEVLLVSPNTGKVIRRPVQTKDSGFIPGSSSAKVSSRTKDSGCISGYSSAKSQSKKMRSEYSTSLSIVSSQGFKACTSLAKGLEDEMSLNEERMSDIQEKVNPDFSPNFMIKQRFEMTCMGLNFRKKWKDVMKDWLMNSEINDEYQIFSDGESLDLDGCRIIFPAGCYHFSSTVKVSLDIDRSDYPDGYIIITPSINLESEMTLLKPVTVMLSTWCVSNGSVQSKKVTVDVLHQDNSGNKWEVLKSLPLSTERTLSFLCQDFSPVVIGLEQDFVGPQEFLVEGYLYTRSPQEFFFSFFFHENAIQAENDKFYKQLGCKLKEGLDTMLLAPGDKITAIIESDSDDHVFDKTHFQFELDYELMKTKWKRLKCHLQCRNSSISQVKIKFCIKKNHVSLPYKEVTFFHELTVHPTKTIEFAGASIPHITIGGNNTAVRIGGSETNHCMYCNAGGTTASVTLSANTPLIGGVQNFAGETSKTVIDGKKTQKDAAVQTDGPGKQHSLADTSEDAHESVSSAERDKQSLSEENKSTEEKRVSDGSNFGEAGTSGLSKTINRSKGEVANTEKDMKHPRRSLRQLNYKKKKKLLVCSDAASNSKKKKKTAEMKKFEMQKEL